MLLLFHQIYIVRLVSINIFQYIYKPMKSKAPVFIYPFSNLHDSISRFFDLNEDCDIEDYKEPFDKFDYLNEYNKQPFEILLNLLLDDYYEDVLHDFCKFAKIIINKFQEFQFNDILNFSDKGFVLFMINEQELHMYLFILIHYYFGI